MKVIIVLYIKLCLFHIHCCFMVLSVQVYCFHPGFTFWSQNVFKFDSNNLDVRESHLKQMYLLNLLGFSSLILLIRSLDQIVTCQSSMSRTILAYVLDQRLADQCSNP